METARRQFRDDLEAEILRILNEEHEAHMPREAVEEIGRKTGINPTEATRLFFNLRGVVWAGTFSRSSDSEHPWDVAHFDVPWFQSRGQFLFPGNSRVPHNRGPNAYAFAGLYTGFREGLLSAAW